MATANATKFDAPADVTALTDVKEWTDREVLDACIRKDERAWRELHRRYDKPLRAAASKRLGERLVERLPSDFRDDIMGNFWLKVVERDMANLRSFDWEQSSGLFNWFARLVGQCATDYAGMILDQPEYAPVEDAHGVADEGGVLASGREPLRGSLSARARRFNEKLAAKAKEEERQRARDGRKRRRAKAKGA
jgi:hypothetical protein